MNNSHDSHTLADAALGDIKHGYMFVGKGRVHPWYGWAIVGIVFGMAMGIVYVANRSVEFSNSQAAYLIPGHELIFFNNPKLSGQAEFTSDGTEQYSISALPVVRQLNPVFGQSTYYIINPVTGQQVSILPTTTRIMVANREFSVNVPAMRATAVNKPIEGTAVTMSSVQGSNTAIDGAKWISVRNTSRTGSKIVSGQKISFVKNINITIPIGYATLSFEASNLPVVVKINNQTVFDARAKSRAINVVQIANFLKQGNNEIRFNLTQNDNNGPSEDPFGLNYKISIVAPAPAVLNNPQGGDPFGDVPADSRPAPVSSILSVSAIKIGTSQKFFAGAKDLELLRFAVSAGGDNDIVVSGMTVADTMTDGIASESFGNYGLWEGNNRVATPVGASVLSGATNRIAFKFDKQFIVNKGKNRTLILRASVLSSPVVNSTHIFSVLATSDVQASGKSGETVIVSGGAPGQSLQIEPIVVTVSGSATEPINNHVRKLADDVASIRLTGSPLAQVTFNKLTLAFSGTAVGASFVVNLKTPTGGTILAANEQVCARDGESSVCYVTFNPNLTIGKNEMVSMRVIVNSANFNNSARTSETLMVSIPKTSDIGFAGAVTTSLTGVTQIANINYQ